MLPFVPTRAFVLWNGTSRKTWRWLGRGTYHGTFTTHVEIRLLLVVLTKYQKMVYRPLVCEDYFYFFLCHKANLFSLRDLLSPSFTDRQPISLSPAVLTDTRRLHVNLLYKHQISAVFVGEPAVFSTSHGRGKRRQQQRPWLGTARTGAANHQYCRRCHGHRSWRRTPNIPRAAQGVHGWGRDWGRGLRQRGDGASDALLVGLEEPAGRGQRCHSLGAIH